MEGGGEVEIGRKWVWTGRLEGGEVAGFDEGRGLACGEGYGEGEFAKGAGRRPGGAERRRNGRSPFARRDGGRPAARMPAAVAEGGRSGGKGRGGQRGKAGGGAGVGRSPFRRSRKPQAEPAETARRAVGLRRDAGAFAFSVRGRGLRPVCLRLLRGGGGVCPKWCAAGERTVPAGGSLV